MDNDFINTYIDVLMQNVHDLTSKNIILDSKLTYADKNNAGSVEQLNDLSARIEQLQLEKDHVIAERDRISNEYHNTLNELNTLRVMVENTRVENSRLQIQLDETIAELAAANSKVQALSITTSKRTRNNTSSM